MISITGDFRELWEMQLIDCFSQALLALFFKCRPAAGRCYNSSCCKAQLSVWGATSAFAGNSSPKLKPWTLCRGIWFIFFLYFKQYLLAFKLLSASCNAPKDKSGSRMYVCGNETVLKVQCQEMYGSLLFSPLLFFSPSFQLLVYL